MKKIIIAFGIMLLMVPVSIALGEEPSATPEPLEEDPIKTPPWRLTSTPIKNPTSTLSPTSPSPPTPTRTPAVPTRTPSDSTRTPTSTPELLTPTFTFAPPTPVFDVCEVDLLKNTTTCGSIDAVTMVVPPGGGQAVVGIDFDPSKYKHTRVAFELHYFETPWGISLNVGDSRTNNGFGGDGRTQSNDAEMQIYNATLAVYGNDGTPKDVRNILRLPLYVLREGVVTVEVKDQYLEWSAKVGGFGRLRSEHLFALNGQADWEGPVNYKIFAGFNRTINAPWRTGTGLGLVVIFLVE